MCEPKNDKYHYHDDDEEHGNGVVLYEPFIWFWLKSCDANVPALTHSGEYNKWGLVFAKSHSSNNNNNNTSTEIGSLARIEQTLSCPENFRRWRFSLAIPNAACCCCFTCGEDWGGIALACTEKIPNLMEFYGGELTNNNKMAKCCFWYFSAHCSRQSLLWMCVRSHHEVIISRLISSKDK